MLEGLTCRKTMPQLKCNVGRRKGNFMELCSPESSYQGYRR